ncbi:MAG: pilus assembly protein PilM [Lachnospiraceae bacterium]|nr:pilus assembly protein PilM [Lachnospiraceae bacterium]
MAKPIVGIDIGSDSVKLALISGGLVRKLVSAPVPNNLVRDYRVVSPESMGEFIRATLKENGIHCKDAAIVFPEELVYVKTVTAPVMTVDQLTYNLPFEFRDYITDELKNYIFDYAMISTPEEILQRSAAGGKAAPAGGKKTEEKKDADADKKEAEGGDAMELLAAAVPINLMAEARSYLRKAGLKLVKASPAVSSYITLIRRIQSIGTGRQEYCVLDLGYRAIRMYMFRGERHMVTRVLEIGLSILDEVLADAYSVDVHLAHTYLLTNYDGCQEKEVCMNAFSNIAVELMRALNFYRFSNPDSQIEDVWLCGGGAEIPQLCDAIRDTLGLQMHSAAELAGVSDRAGNCSGTILAIGAALS